MYEGSIPFSILTGISKTLGVAKEVIPLWQQTKPIIKNAKTAYSLIRNIKPSTIVDEVKNKTLTPEVKQIKSDAKQILTHEKTIIKSNNSPQFFI